MRIPSGFFTVPRVQSEVYDSVRDSSVRGGDSYTAGSLKVFAGILQNGKSSRRYIYRFLQQFEKSKIKLHKIVTCAVIGMRHA